MSYRVIWTPQSIRDLRRLDRPTVQRIRDGVERLASDNQGDVKRLAGVYNQFRLRIGDWRIRFTIQQDIQILSVLRVLPRGEAYKRL